MPSETLQTWLRDVAADEICVDPTRPNAEAQANLWTFGPAAGASLSDWREFVGEVVLAREHRLRVRGMSEREMRLYCWHDQQAGQLRLSLISASPGRLPFGSPVAAAELDDVLRSWLGLVQTPLVPVQVWSVELPRPAGS